MAALSNDVIEFKDVMRRITESHEEIKDELRDHRSAIYGASNHDGIATKLAIIQASLDVIQGEISKKTKRDFAIILLLAEIAGEHIVPRLF
ncbi:MAG: hypothetical protein ACU843_12865 [Gammaproteobacteria bacterium]